MSESKALPRALVHFRAHGSLRDGRPPKFALLNVKQLRVAPALTPALNATHPPLGVLAYPPISA